MGKIGQAVTEGKEGGRGGALKGADSFIRQRNLTYCCRMLHEAWYTCSCHTTPPLSPLSPAWLAAISLTKFAHKSACKVLPAYENACACHSPRPARGRFNNAKMRPQVCSSSGRARACREGERGEGCKAAALRRGFFSSRTANCVNR